MRIKHIIAIIIFVLQGCGSTNEENINEARVLILAGNTTDALELLDEIIENDLENHDAYNMRGITKLELGQNELAIRDFNVSLALDSNDYRSYYNRGNAYYQNENFSQAVLDFDAAMQLEPKEADIYINRGNALVQLQRYSEAVYDYEFALKIENDNYLTHFNLARAHYLTDSLELAKHSFETCLILYNTFAPAYYFLGMIALEKNELETSCLLLQKAAELGYMQAVEVQKLYCRS